MLSKNDKITTPQTVALILTIVIGVGIVSLPSSLAEETGPDSWLAVLGGGIIALLGVVLITTTGKLFPDKTFVDYAPKVMGYLGHVLNLGLLTYLILFVGITTRLFAEVVKVFLLERTPIEVVILSLLVLVVYLTRHGIEPVARTAEVLFPLVILPTIIIYAFILVNGDFTNFLPFLRSGISDIVSGIQTTVTSFLGFEVLLLIIPFMQSPRQATYAGFIGLTVITAFYLFVVLTVISNLGIVETSLLMWPAISLIRSTDVVGTIFPRLDIIILSLWTLAGFTTVSPLMYGAALGISRMVGAREHKAFIMPLVPPVFFVAMLPQNIFQTQTFAEQASYLGVFYIFIAPLIIMVVYWVRKRVRGQ